MLSETQNHKLWNIEYSTKHQDAEHLQATRTSVNQVDVEFRKA